MNLAAMLRKQLKLAKELEELTGVRKGAGTVTIEGATNRNQCVIIEAKIYKDGQIIKSCRAVDIRLIGGYRLAPEEIIIAEMEEVVRKVVSIVDGNFRKGL